MKFSLLIPFLASCAVTAVTAQQRPVLLSDLPDGSEAPPAEVPAAFQPAEVPSTTVTRQGGRDIIAQQLALDPNDPIRLAVAPEAHVPVPTDEASSPPDTAAGPSHLLLLSATVNPGPRTHPRWTHHFGNGTQQEYSGWSNIDLTTSPASPPSLPAMARNILSSWASATKSFSRSFRSLPACRSGGICPSGRQPKRDLRFV